MVSNFGVKLWLLLRRFPSLLRCSTAGFWVLAGCIASHNRSVGFRWCRCWRWCDWPRCLVVWSWKRWSRRCWKLRWNSSWSVIDERALTGALLCVVTIVVPVGMFASLFAVLGVMTMLATSLTESAGARCETAFRTDGMPMRAAVVNARMNIREASSGWR